MFKDIILLLKLFKDTILLLELYIGCGGMCHIQALNLPPQEILGVDLDDTLSSKTIHGVFFKQATWDTSKSHVWFLDRRLRDKIEGLIVAAKDNVIHTRAYQVRVMKKPVSLLPLCFGCH